MKTHPVLKSFFVLQFLIFIFSNVLIAKTNILPANIYGRLTALQCDSLIKANETNPNFVILDVRTPLEWENYHIKGSINRSTGLTDFTAQLNSLPKQKIFLLHCQSGGRSAGAFAKMKELNFAEVYEMIGGINAWNTKGLPTTKITEPKLMLVSYSEISKGRDSDTVKVTITNRANGNLTFSNFRLSDVHQVQNNFNRETILDGARDYTFSIIHTPGYFGEDSTKMFLESNGGNLELNIAFKNGSVTGMENQQVFEISLYPNPARDKIYFNRNSASIFDEITIFNIAGQIVYNRKQVSGSNGIDVSGFNNGIYILRIKKSGQIISRKFTVGK